jgi:hypothetical protein
MIGIFFACGVNCSLEKDPKHIGSLCAFGAIAVRKNDVAAIQKVETALRSMASSPKNRQAREFLSGISISTGQNVDDFSRVGILLDPSSAVEWIKLSKGGDAVADLSLKLASRDPTIDTEDMARICEASESRGALQSGILLSPWRVEGWKKLKVMGEIDN